MAEHGGNIYSVKRELSLIDVIDFSANISPLGVPESIKKALAVNIDKLKNYPDPECRKMRNEIARFYGINTGFIVCGNGGADLIFRLVNVLKPKKALIPVPTFSEYEEALESSGCQLKKIMMEHPFEPSEKILDELCSGEYDFLVICNPNNPTGCLIDPELLGKIMIYCKEHHIHVLLDECFYDMTADELGVNSYISYISEFPNVFILKSMTKMYAIPGIRLGYGISSDTELIRKISLYGQPWAVNVMAEIAGVAALNDSEYRHKFRNCVFDEKKYLYEGLKNFGFEVWEPTANYIFFRAAGLNDLSELLLEKYIIIRSCNTYDGLSDDYYRVAVRSHTENYYLLRSLKKILNMKGVTV